MSNEERRTLEKRKDRMVRATQSKVQADKKDKIAAKSYSDKIVAKMQRAGQL